MTDRKPVEIKPRHAIIGGRVHTWRAWPTFSVVGMIALTISLVLLAPIIYAFDVIDDQQSLFREQQKRLSVLAKEGAQAHAAECAQRERLRQQIDASRMYLLDVAAGRRKPIVGLSVRDVNDGIARDSAALSALRVLTCAKKRPASK